MRVSINAFCGKKHVTYDLYQAYRILCEVMRNNIICYDLFFALTSLKNKYKSY